MERSSYVEAVVGEGEGVVVGEGVVPSQGVDTLTTESRGGLRPYQTLAVQSLREAIRNKQLRLMLASPTGSGKTEIGMEIIRGALAKSKRPAFLVNRIELVNQASRRFHKARIMHSIIQGQNTRNLGERVSICSIQTVARRGMPDCDLILIDEAHAVAGSKDYRAIMEKAKGIPVIGLSATPFSHGLGKHNAELGGPLFQEIIVAARISDLITQGYLVDCEVYAPSSPDMSGFKTKRTASGELDWSDADVGKASDKPELIGDIVEHWLKLAAGTPTVCFASNIAHSEHIAAQFVAAGVKAEHIDCYTPDEERKAILERVASGETKVISNVGILCEGWDFPACSTLILARPTKSLIRYLQMAGRVLRPFPGKSKALILDHSGTVVELGFPTDDQNMELHDGSPGKSKVAELKPLKPHACSNCKHVTTLHCCPRCGFKPARDPNVTVLEGELKKIAKASKIGKQQFFSELYGYAKQRQCSEGRIAHLYRDKFGVWPKNLAKVAIAPSQETLNYIRACNIAFAKRFG